MGEVTPAVQADGATKVGPVGKQEQKGQPLGVPLLLGPPDCLYPSLVAPGLSIGGLGLRSNLQTGGSGLWTKCYLTGFVSCKVWIKWDNFPSPKMHIATQMHILKYE